MHALGRWHREAEIATDGHHGCQQDLIINCGGVDSWEKSTDGRVDQGWNWVIDEGWRVEEDDKILWESLGPVEGSEWTVRARAVEEYKSSDACDDNNTKYFRVGFELQIKKAKEKYPDLDFYVFQPYKDDDFVTSVEERNEAAVSVDPQLTDDATT